jgi:polyisoprenoid-binding protein YceI
MYKNIRLFFFFSLLVITANLNAQSLVYVVSKGAISFTSDGALELIKASSDELRGIFNIAKKQFAFKIRVSSLNGFNSPLQKEHFNENYLETTKYPFASFEGKIIEDIDLTKDAIITVRAKGNLLVHGVLQERIIKSIVVIKNNVVSIKSNFSVFLADHNITIPKVVNEKLASEIKVEIKATLAVK